MDINQYKPTGDIKNKHFVTLIDYAPQEIFELLHSAVRLKKRLRGGIRTDVLKGKTIALIFAKSSTRTRVSFEMGIRQLGGHALFLSSADIQLGRGETIEDTVKTLERLGIEGIMIRTFAHSDVEKLCRAGKIPVINGLTDLCHPCQALADLLTIWEKKKRLEGLKLAYFGDGNNMANSLIAACAKSGIEIAVACPKDCLPDKTFIEEGKKCGKVTITGNPQEAADGADILYTDVFFSMGQHTDPVKKQALMPFQVNAALMKKAKPDAIFMHCLPAHRGEEVTADVIDSHASVIFDQAENRLHAQKAVLFHLFKER
jgi:ornithine carbamoyltransferase